MLDWTTLALLCLAGAAAWFWHDSLAAREAANAAAAEACARLALQFLDGTVAFARIGLARDASGRLTLRRTYHFDYTANSIERRQGFVVVVGRRVETVGYTPDVPKKHPDPVRPSPSQGKPAEIIRLDEWRRSRRKERSRSYTALPDPRDNKPEQRRTGAERTTTREPDGCD
ncbi:MAG: DUF3301 domain-containing protein [Gammaproteobacteria bacterium]|nr:hypothetical protein [Gammaproteobacteria bacterium]